MLQKSELPFLIYSIVVCIISYFVITNHLGEIGYAYVTFERDEKRVHDD